VAALVGVVAHRADAQFQLRLDGADQAALADAAVAGQDGRPVPQHVPQGVQPDVAGDAGAEGRDAERGVVGQHLVGEGEVVCLCGLRGGAVAVGGVGGGGIFVPMLNLVVGFDTKSAAALSKCMIMGASASSVWYNLQVSHPTKEAPVIDYKLALLFQPMLMLGITIGVELSVIFPYWLITVLIIILFVGTSSRSFYKGILMWREETRILMETREREEQSKAACAANDVVIDPSYEEPLLTKPQPKVKSALETFLFNLRWKNILVLMSVWSCFLVLQVLKVSLLHSEYFLSFPFNNSQIFITVIGTLKR
jgi:hypothetical protein